jgi:hypothetical protein
MEVTDDFEYEVPEDVNTVLQDQNASVQEYRLQVQDIVEEARRIRLVPSGENVTTDYEGKYKWRVQNGMSPEQLTEIVFNYLKIMTPNDILAGVSVHGWTATDVNGVFRTLTYTVTTYLRSMYCDTLSKTPYFAEDDSNQLLPNNQTCNIEDSDWYMLFGKYMLLTFIHDGSFPNWVHTYVIKCIMKQSFELTDASNINHFLIKTIRELDVHVAKNEWNATMDQLNADHDNILLAYNVAHLRNKHLLDRDEGLALRREWKLGLLKHLICCDKHQQLCSIREGFQYALGRAALDSLNYELIVQLGFKECKTIKDVVLSFKADYGTEVNKEWFRKVLAALQLIPDDKASALYAAITGTKRMPCEPLISCVFKDTDPMFPHFHTCFKTIDLFKQRYMVPTEAMLNRVPQGVDHEVFLLVEDFNTAIAQWEADPMSFQLA